MTASTETPQMADIFNNLRRIFQALNEQSKQAEKETGLTGPQLWMILTLEKEGIQRVTSLAEKLFLHPATVVGILNRLEDKGIIVRRRTQRDRRAVDVELTDIGRDIARQAPDVPQGKLAAGLATLAQEDIEEISRSLDKIVSLLDAQTTKPVPIAYQG